MTVELLQTLSMVSYIIAGVLLLVSIALFFILGVPKLYGDISGRTAKRAIEAIRQQNESTGDKAYKSSAVNVARGRITDKITLSGQLKPQTSTAAGVGTEKLPTASLTPQSNETTVLANETTVLNEGSGETTVLKENRPTGNSGETTVLKNSGLEETSTKTEFSIDVEMSFAGSTEIID